MEPSQILLFLLALTPFILFYCLNNLKSRKPGVEKTSHRLPPGTSGLPFIGESVSYYLKLRRGRQYEFVKERMDKYSSKVFRTSFMGKPVAVLCGPEGNKFLFANENKLVRLWWPDSINKLFPKSDNRPNTEHSRMLHKNVLPFFLKPDALRQCVGLMDDVMKQHLETYWTGKNEVKVGEMAKKFTLALACNFFLGINDLGQIEDVVRGIDDIDIALMAIRINLPGTAWNRGLRASKTLQSKIETFVRQRKQSLSSSSSSSSSSSITSKDFITHMLLAVDENGQFYKEGDIACHVASMIEAAYTTLQMTMLIKKLSDIPTVCESVLREQTEIAEWKEAGNSLSWENIRKMKYSWNVVCEVFRLYLSGLSFKEAITDFKYEGYTIPKGWKIHLITHGTHKNPKYFKDPENFDPTRFDGDGPAPYSFVPFAGGPRMCPGNEYARLASLTFVHYVVTKFSWEKIIPDEEVLHFPFAYPAQGLPIRLYPRK